MKYNNLIFYHFSVLIYDFGATKTKRKKHPIFISTSYSFQMEI